MGLITEKDGGSLILHYSTEHKLRALLTERLDGARRSAESINVGLECGLASCESPIERLFLAEAVTYFGASFSDLGPEYPLHPPYFFFREFVPERERFRFRLFPQYLIENTEYKRGASPFKYRVDFVLTTERDEARTDFMEREIHYRYAIELDGHEFHERTKEQAQRDRERDRNLAAIGYQVLRYTGSEIYKDSYELISKLDTLLCADAREIVKRLGP